MYIINVTRHYDSAHFLREYNGKCERLHGHRYMVEAAMALRGPRRGRHGVRLHRRQARAACDDRRAGPPEPQRPAAFHEIETSAENQARYIFDEMKATARRPVGEPPLRPGLGDPEPVGSVLGAVAADVRVSLGAGSDRCHSGRTCHTERICHSERSEESRARPSSRSLAALGMTHRRFGSFPVCSG